MNPIADNFEQIVLISLADRPDRRQHALKQIDRFFDGRPSNLHIFDAIRPTEAAGFPSIGARGCFLSHRAVLKDALTACARNILVLEDDIEFSGTMPEQVPPCD